MYAHLLLSCNQIRDDRKNDLRVLSLAGTEFQVIS